jgi:hypothetical protein
VGPSHPTRAWHSCDGEHVPFDPLVTSNSDVECWYGKSLASMVAALPASPYTEAMIGEDALVPPKTSQPEKPWNAIESNTATPVFGSATADTSATARRGQPVSNDAALGIAVLNAEQPLPAPDQADSVQPRVFAARVSEVPPTATTNDDEAGYSTPKPPSPEDAVTAMPGWL